MNRKRILIISTGIVVLLLGIYFLVSTVSGSSSSVSIEGCNPYNIQIHKGNSDNSVEILWKSKNECSAYIVYGNKMKDLNLVGVDLDHGAKSRDHRIVLNSIMSSKTYFFSIVSDGVTYGKDGLPVSFSISSL